MSRIDDIFKELRQNNQRTVMPFVVAGHPGMDATESCLASLDSTGVRIAEVGIPFSDPIADGPTIAAAMHESLNQGVTVETVLSTIKRVRNHTSLGLIAMVSMSIVHRKGGTAFIEALAEHGFDGVIIPDIDLHEADAFLPTIDQLDLSFAMLVAPTTTEDRLHSLLDRCRGFVYLLARTGLTGTRGDLPDLTPRVEAIRERTDLPIAAGFGISTADQVSDACTSCDAAIVGSALVKAMNQSPEDALALVESLLTGLVSR